MPPTPATRSPGAAAACDDGSQLLLQYNGSPELHGTGFDDITGSIRQ